MQVRRTAQICKLQESASTDGVVLFVVEKSAAAPFGVAVFCFTRMFLQQPPYPKKEGEKVCLRKCR